MTEEDIMWQLQQMEEGQESDGEEYTQEEVISQEEEAVPQEEEEETKDKSPELSEQDRIAKFNELLKESNISPFAVYTIEYPKLMTDPRFSCECLCL